MSAPRNIGIFGGTFDPVHLGHIHLADTARRILALDEVRFLPCFISPHKSDSVPTPVADRLEMLRIATRDLPWAVVDDFEALRGGPSYSWQTAEAMKQQFSGDRLFWIMGTDQWEVLSQWREPDRLAACVEFAVFSRGATPAPRSGYVLHAMDAGHPASATDIREAIATGGPDPHPWLDSGVDRWIREHQIYQKIRSINS